MTSLRLPILAGAVAGALSPCGCALVAEDARPAVNFGAEVADKFVHRGMPQNRNGVLQGSLDVTLPMKWQDSIAVGTFGNLNLNDSTGAAWLPDGHGGRFSVIEYTATYARSLGPVAIATGVHNYNVPDGITFPNGPRSATNEAFLIVGGEVLGARPELMLRYDFDQADGFYGRAGIGEDFPITDKLNLELRGHIGYSSSASAWWDYGIRDAGISDLQGTAVLTYAWDAHTEIGVDGNFSTIVDDGISRWFDQISIPTENWWVGVFVSWSY